MCFPLKALREWRAGPPEPGQRGQREAGQEDVDVLRPPGQLGLAFTVMLFLGAWDHVACWAPSGTKGCETPGHTPHPDEYLIHFE